MLLQTTCAHQCCILSTRKRIEASRQYMSSSKVPMRAGVLFYNQFTKRVLLVQSCGNKWGPPKGAAEAHETPEQCAIREVFEETGLIISPTRLRNARRFRIGRSYYFCIQTNVCVQGRHVRNSTGNDVTGISWVRIPCLVSMKATGVLKLNRDCRVLLEALRLLS